MSRLQQIQEIVLFLIIKPLLKLDAACVYLNDIVIPVETK